MHIVLMSYIYKFCIFIRRFEYKLHFHGCTFELFCLSHVKLLPGSEHKRTHCQPSLGGLRQGGGAFGDCLDPAGRTGHVSTAFWRGV